MADTSKGWELILLAGALGLVGYYLWKKQQAQGAASQTSGQGGTQQDTTGGGTSYSETGGTTPTESQPTLTPVPSQPTPTPPPSQPSQPSPPPTPTPTPTTSSLPPIISTIIGLITGQSKPASTTQVLQQFLKPIRILF
jgi:outer membrane biosynthesis protein TonB